MRVGEKRLFKLRSFLVAAIVLLAGVTPLLAQVPEPLAQEKEIDQQHLRHIYQAIQAYRKDHGDLPTWLSDLVPHYLPDPAVLVSPFEERTGRSALWGYVDPKARTSYVYEFGGNPAGGSVNQGREQPLTMKQWKSLQMEEFGPAIPILRCHLYSPVLNVAYAGELYETALFWETDANTLALAKRLGMGPGSKEEKWMTVKAVDAQTGQPLADVEVTATNRRSTLGPLPTRTMKTDTHGQCRVPLGWGEPQTLSLDFAKANYAGTPLSWNESTAQKLPAETTAKLQPAVLIGGIVRSADGKPIAEATVAVSGVVRDQVGQTVLASYDTVKTDADGRWSSRRVPNDFEALNFKLAHPEFLPAEYDQAEGGSPGQKEVAKPDLLAARSTMVMQPAIHVEGVVSRGTQPVAGARVVLRDTSDSPTNQVHRTDAQGRFSFVVLEEGAFELAVEADRASPALQHLSVKAGLKPLAISLQPAKTIRGRVTDETGQPLDQAEVSVTAWQDLPILSWRTTTDAQGLFTWDSAPEDTVTLFVSKAGYNGMASSVTGDSTEPVAFQLSKSFRLSGSVVDADTGAPIKAFRLLRGSLWDPGDTNRVNWERGAETFGSEGRYTINGLQNYFGGMGQVKFMVLADGYLPQSTPALSASGWHTQDFALHKGQGPRGLVKLPDGGPVAGAEVALLGMGYLSLGKGAFRTAGAGNNDNFVVHTDTNGAFALPAVLPSPTIAAVHSKGFAEIAGDQLATNAVVVLEPWGKVEGTVWLSHDVGTNEAVMIADGAGTGGINFDWSEFKTEADSLGRFSFSSVPPGKRQVVRLLPQGNGSWMWADQTPVTVKPGQTTEVKLGGSGCRIVGRLVASDSTQKLDWESGRFNLHTAFPRPPGTFKSRQEAEEWNNSPAVRTAREQHRNYPVTVRSDGSFRADNVRAGKYTLDLTFTQPEEGRPMGMGQTVGRISKEIIVPGDSADSPQALLDLGTLELKLAASLSPGKPAPEIQGEDVEGAKFKLSEYRGKVVLIDFWGDW